MKLGIEVTVNIGKYENIRVAAEDDSGNYTDFGVPIAACQDALKDVVVAFLQGLGEKDPDVKRDIAIYLYRVFGVGEIPMGKEPSAPNAATDPPQATPGSGDGAIPLAVPKPAPEPPKAAQVATTPAKPQPHKGGQTTSGPKEIIVPTEKMDYETNKPHENIIRIEPTGIMCQECNAEIMDRAALQASKLLLGKHLCRKCYKTAMEFEKK